MSGVAIGYPIIKLVEKQVKDIGCILGGREVRVSDTIIAVLWPRPKPGPYMCHESEGQVDLLAQNDEKFSAGYLLANRATYFIRHQRATTKSKCAFALVAEVSRWCRPFTRQS
jgi:hypothetical protein